MIRELLEPSIVYIPDGSPFRRDSSVNIPSEEITLNHEVDIALRILAKTSKKIAGESGQTQLLATNPVLPEDRDGSLALELTRVRFVDAKRQRVLRGKLMDSISKDPK